MAENQQKQQQNIGRSNGKKFARRVSKSNTSIIQIHRQNCQKISIVVCLYGDDTIPFSLTIPIFSANNIDVFPYPSILISERLVMAKSLRISSFSKVNGPLPEVNRVNDEEAQSTSEDISTLGSLKLSLVGTLFLPQPVYIYACMYIYIYACMDVCMHGWMCVCV